MSVEYKFNKNFIDILIKYIDEQKLYLVYKLDNETKYTIDYIFNIIKSLSNNNNNNNNNRLSLPINLINYLKLSQYSLYTKKTIRNFIKQQIIKIENDDFLKTYIVIGHEYPNVIKELTVII